MLLSNIQIQTLVTLLKSIFVLAILIFPEQAQLKLADTLKKISETAGLNEFRKITTIYIQFNYQTIIITSNFLEKNNVDLGVNIADDLEDLKKNLDMYKVKVSPSSPQSR